MKFATAYDRESWFKKEPTVYKSESLTDQSYRLDTDVVYLLSNGVAPTRTPIFGDNYDKLTLEGWQNKKAEIKRDFRLLTDEQKARFGYSPSKFLEYCANPKNYVKMEEEKLDPPPVEVKPHVKEPPVAPTIKE